MEHSDLTREKIIELAIREKARREKARREAEAKAKQESGWENYAMRTKIRSGKTFTNFYPFPHQQLINQIINNHYGTVIVKSRQMGLTEFFGSRYCYKAQTNRAFASALFSKSQDDTNDIARRVRQMLASQSDGDEEDYLKSILEHDSLNYMKFKHGGQLYFRPSSPGSGRGLPSITEILYDEVAHTEYAREIYEGSISATEALGEDARIAINSTPLGKSGFYYEMVMSGNPDSFDLDKTIEKVVNGELYSNNLPGFYWFVDEAGWAKVFVHWRCHPIYGKDPNFVETQRKKKKLTLATANREYNLSFLDASNLIFSHDIIERAAVAPPDPQVHNPQRKYVAGIDPNHGKHDYFCLVIIDITDYPYRVVDWIYKNNQPVNVSIASALTKLKLWNPKAIKVEVNANRLAFEMLSSLLPSKNVIPINTTQTLKTTNTDRLVFLMEQDQFKFPNRPEFKEEFKNFVENPSTRRRQAAYGFFDDFIMACAVALDSEDGNESPLDTLEKLVGRSLNCPRLDFPSRASIFAVRNKLILPRR